jgi:hypothetical protein
MIFHNRKLNFLKTSLYLDFTENELTIACLWHLL